LWYPTSFAQAHPKFAAESSQLHPRAKFERRNFCRRAEKYGSERMKPCRKSGLFRRLSTSELIPAPSAELAPLRQIGPSKTAAAMHLLQKSGESRHLSRILQDAAPPSPIIPLVQITAFTITVSQETNPEHLMKTKPDWLAIIAALTLGYVVHLMVTSESIVFPALLGAIVMHVLVVRLSRRHSS
jgi:hypothetical protein